jgi:hypothetical protein
MPNDSEDSSIFPRGTISRDVSKDRIRAHGIMSAKVFTESGGIDVQGTIANRINAAAHEYSNKIFRYLIFVLAGALVAVIWGLNGQIYQAVGASSVSTKALEIEITRLQREIKRLEKQITQRDCLEDKRVVHKSGCYHGN